MSLTERIEQRWRALGQWPKAAIAAVLLLVLLHACVFRWVSVRSTSMQGTLLPGDLLLVQRWPLITGFDRGDIVVFRDPVQDRSGHWRRDLLVKRIVGLPGDTVELRKGQLYVNGRAMVVVEQADRYHVRFRSTDQLRALLDTMALPFPDTLAGRTGYELQLTAQQAEQLRAQPGVLAVEAAGLARGTPRHIFPYSPWYKWNNDNWGPVRIPAEGDTVMINERSFPLYDRLITRYAGHRVSFGSDGIRIDGALTDRYRIEQDHYFTLGDARQASNDSRYWGFLPADHLVGRAASITLSTDRAHNTLRAGRWGKSLR